MKLIKVFKAKPDKSLDTGYNIPEANDLPNYQLIRF